MRAIRAPDRSLWADVRGHGDPVILLHGQPGTGRDWSAVTPLLTGACQVVAVDRPGYGRSHGPAGGFEANARAVVATLDELGIERAVVVGHSWGGGVALTLAGGHAHRVRGLVLVSSIGPGARPGRLDRLLGSPLIGDAVVAGTFGAVRTALGWRGVRRGLGAVLPPTSRATLEVVAGGIRSEPPGSSPWRSFLVEQRVYNAGVDDLAAHLAAVDVPCTVVTGTDDRIVDPSVSSGMARSIPGARLVRIRGAGHLLPFDHPGEIAEAVRDVTGLAAPGPPPDPGRRPGCGRR